VNKSAAELGSWGRAVNDHTSLRRGIAILRLLGRPSTPKPGLGVTEIANALEYDKSQVSRILPVLVEAGFAERDRETRKYRLGWGLHGVSIRLQSSQLCGLSRPVLRTLSDHTGESSHLIVLAGVRIFSICNEIPAREVGYRLADAPEPTGAKPPAYCTASGRALLTDFSEGELRQLYEGRTFARRGPKSIRTVDELITTLDRERVAGYAVSEDELDDGLTSIAVPIRDVRGDVALSVGISAATDRLRPKLDVAVRATRGAAREIARRIAVMQTTDREDRAR
jgi:DNA-binding IclR family transcriptional regulator